MKGNELLPPKPDFCFCRVVHSSNSLDDVKVCFYVFCFLKWQQVWQIPLQLELGSFQLVTSNQLLDLQSDYLFMAVWDSLNFGSFQGASSQTLALNHFTFVFQDSFGFVLFEVCSSRNRFKTLQPAPKSILNVHPKHIFLKQVI